MKSTIAESRPRVAARLLALLIAGAACAPLAAAQQPFPGPEAYSAGRFNRSDELKLKGQVLRVDALETGAILWLQASDVEKAGAGSRAGHAAAPGAGKVWRIEGEGVEKVKDAPELKPGAMLTVTGLNHTDIKCEPTCRLNSKRVQFAK